MAYECVVGLKINDDTVYAQYRQHMLPILNRYGGGFRYDFKISEVLKNEEGRPINRVFLIYFKDKKSMDLFFLDSEYIKVRKAFFDMSVEHKTLISQYEITI